MTGPDIIVVGGGPAGAATATHLARQGRRVTLVERATFPRPKPCGDCLSAAATPLLAELGVLPAVLRAGAARIREWRIRSPAGHVCEGRFDGTSALALERRVLDDIFLRAAVDAGVAVVRARITGLTGSGVRLGAPGRERTLSAPLVVGADGLRSTTARQAGLIRRRPRLGKVSLTTHGSGDPALFGHGEMHVLDGACFGLAPAGAGRFNLTLVVHERHARDLGAIGADAFFRRWLDRAASIRARVRPDALDRPFLASGPFDWPTRSPIAPRLALVGDAAGYYDPFTGQGIHHALAGARMLAEALEGVSLARRQSLAPALDRYARAHRRLARPSRLVQRAVELALAEPDRADRVLRRLSRAPAATDRLVEVTGDLRSPIALLSPRPLSSFFFPPSPEVP